MKEYVKPQMTVLVTASCRLLADSQTIDMSVDATEEGDGVL
jgi:hypothetical protein